MKTLKIKNKRDKKICLKRKLSFENYENCLEGTQFDNKKNILEKHEVNVDYKELIKNNKLILKTQQRFKSKRHIVFTKEIDCFTKDCFSQMMRNKRNQLI